MTVTHWAIDIDRDSIDKAELVQAEDTTPGEGEVEVALDLYAMTANNITYAVFGKPVGLFGNDKGYWDFFSPEGGPGRLPVWGFATVTGSRCDGVAEGDCFYGYFPMASHAKLKPGKVSPGGFTDVAEHRLALPIIYNQYQKLTALADYREADRPYWPVFRPLFLTGWLIADQFEDDGDYGAEELLIASASSKTAIGLGHSMKQREGGPRTVGLTSPAHVDHVASLGIYDRVVGYDAIDTLDGSVPSALVDMAGNGAVTRAVHEHFGDALRYSMVVGKSHWDADAEGGALPGPQRMGFFAPGRSEKRVADWGGAAFQARIGTAWQSFVEEAGQLAEIDRRSGGEAALAAYREVLSGSVDPARAVVVEP